MRAAIVLALIAAAAAIALFAMPRARADGPRKTAIIFDHNVHDRDVVVSGAESLPCTRCHTVKAGLLVGRPDHESCFGSCHGAAPAAGKPGDRLVIAPSQFKVCMRCHAESALLAPRRKSLAVAFPPYTATDFALTVGHKLHREVTCTACHGSPGATRRGVTSPAATKPVAPHRRCVGCHDGAPGRGPMMSACKGCHLPGSGTPDPPRLQLPTNTVTSTFSHRKHAARGGNGAQCIACHAEVRDADDNILPRPKASACGASGCHDGTPVFAVTAACTKCHERPPQGKFVVARPQTRFSHASHIASKLACVACHPQDNRGEVLVAGHAACAGCHGADFADREPKICGACHNATEPWRKLVADRRPPDRTEFGATLDHAKHKAECTTCHSLTTTTKQLRPPRGHGACMISGCHATTSGPAPQLGSCEACHALGLADKRIALRTAASWSVRERFDHTPHLRTNDGTQLACTSCHRSLEGASVTALPAPPKTTCAPCHDGTTAFKLTGTSCTRCHPGAK